MGLFSWNKNTVEKQRTEAPAKDKTDKFAELGVAGAHISSGFVHDEFLTQLVGEKGRRVYREMRDNDPTIGAILFAVEMMMRAVNWEVKFDEIEGETDSTGGENDTTSVRMTPEEAVAFVEGILFDDMNQTFDDVIGQILSMLTFGWQYTEIVWKRRDGIKDEGDDTPSSIFDDGMIGIHKLADRSQETLDRWDVDDQGRVFGMWQQPPNGGTETKYIPMTKSLLFRPHMFKGSPEGRSTLRNAYRPWFFCKNIQEIEAIVIERELAGLPVVKIPNEILQGTTPEAINAKAQYIKMVRDIKFNEQGGVVIPSNPWYDSEGNPTSLPQVELQLLSTGGSRAIDPDTVIKRYQGDIARTVLADFVMLGQGDKGSFALSSSKTDLFLQAISGWLESIASEMNRHLLPKIWRINGLDPAVMPYLCPGNVAPDDITELGDFVQKLSGAGFMLADQDTEEYLRRTAGLPQAPEQTEDEVIFDEE